MWIMSTSNSEQLAEYVRSLPDFIFYETIDGNYNHMGATVADAILQANMRYSTHVKPRVNRILEIYPNSKTTTEVLQLLNEIDGVKFLNWRGADRVERVLLILALFRSESIETEENLKEWLANDSNLLKLRLIKGIGPKTVDYFKILVGLHTAAIDRHLRNFLKMAGLKLSTYDEEKLIVNETAKIFVIDPARFDHSIWQYMSKRAAKSKVHENCIK